MGNRHWKRRIARLEAAGNDDFQLILVGGAGPYATHELHHLLRRLRLQSIAVRKWKNTMFKVALCLPAFMALGCFAGLFSQLTLVYVFLTGIPLAMIALIGMSWYTGRRFSCVDKSKRVQCLIQQELERRREDATRFY